MSSALPRGPDDTFFFFNDTATPEIYTLPLRDALPISYSVDGSAMTGGYLGWVFRGSLPPPIESAVYGARDRKSTRLNSSHANISYAVFCLKKKQKPADLPGLPHLSDGDRRHAHRYALH